VSFDRVAVLDWSAAQGPRRGADSIWLGLAGAAGETVENLPTRRAAEARLAALVAAAGPQRRLLLGCDFAFGYPRGFAGPLTGRRHAFAVWDWLAARVQETAAHGSTYRAAAAEANARFGGGPFWGDGTRAGTPGLPRRKPPLPPGLAEHRACEIAGRDGGARPKSLWQLAGAGAVGAQTMTGLPVLARLRAAAAGRLAVWPFEPPAGSVVLAEVYPSLLGARVAAAGGVKDAAQVRLLARALRRLAQDGRLSALLDVPADPEEGWILGAGHGALLRAASD
jgi:hypothetical protein